MIIAREAVDKKDVSFGHIFGMVDAPKGPPESDEDDGGSGEQRAAASRRD